MTQHKHKVDVFYGTRMDGRGSNNKTAMNPSLLAVTTCACTFARLYLKALNRIHTPCGPCAGSQGKHHFIMLALRK